MFSVARIGVSDAAELDAVGGADEVVADGFVARIGGNGWSSDDRCGQGACGRFKRESGSCFGWSNFLYWASWADRGGLR